MKKTGGAARMVETPLLEGKELGFLEDNVQAIIQKIDE